MNLSKLLFLCFLFNISQFQKCDFDSLVNLTPKCKEQINEFIQEFTTNHPPWTQQMVDATSRVRRATPTFDDYGDFDQCLGVSNPNGTIFGKYCFGTVLDKENPVVDENSLWIPIWALCLPDGCRVNDSTTVGNVVLSCLLGTENFMVEFSNTYCQTFTDANPPLSVEAIITIVVLSLITLCVVVSSFYEYYYTGTTPTIIKAFSLITNCTSTFKIKPPQIEHFPCLDGFRCISMLWVLSVHIYTISVLGAVAKTNVLLNWSTYLSSKLFINASYSVDTFFVIGGTVLSYGFMKARKTNQPFNVVRYYLHRYLRLIGPFALMVLINSTLFEYMGSGPRWLQMKNAYQQACQKYWWSAILYVQNYVNPGHMCLISSWYLMLDMQLYLISPIVFLLLWKYPKPGQTLIGIYIIGSTCLSLWTVWDNELFAFGPLTYKNKFKYSRTVAKYHFVTPLRAPPWLIGAILGNFIFKIKEGNAKVVLKKSVLSVLWVLSLGTLLVCVFIVQIYGMEYDALVHGLHAAFSRPLWSLAIAWIIFACITDYGGPINWLLSQPIFHFFNKFIYSIYVVQETVITVIVYNKKYPGYFSDFQEMYDFWGMFFLCFGLAVLIVLMVESPIATMEKLLFKKFECKLLPKSGIGNFRNVGGRKQTSGGTDGTFGTVGAT